MPRSPWTVHVPGTAWCSPGTVQGHQSRDSPGTSVQGQSRDMSRDRQSRDSPGTSVQGHGHDSPGTVQGHDCSHVPRHVNPGTCEQSLVPSQRMVHEAHMHHIDDKRQVNARKHSCAAASDPASSAELYSKRMTRLNRSQRSEHTYQLPVWIIDRAGPAAACTFRR
jgi:hypothetical protein